MRKSQRGHCGSSASSRLLLDTEGASGNSVFGKRSAQEWHNNSRHGPTWWHGPSFEVLRKLTSTHQANVFAYLCFMLIFLMVPRPDHATLLPELLKQKPAHPTWKSTRNLGSAATNLSLKCPWGKWRYYGIGTHMSSQVTTVQPVCEIRLGARRS